MKGRKKNEQSFGSDVVIATSTDLYPCCLQGAAGTAGAPGMPGSPGMNGRRGKDGEPGQAGEDGRPVSELIQKLPGFSFSFLVSLFCSE